MTTAASQMRPSIAAPPRFSVRALTVGGASLVAILLIAAGVAKIVAPDPQNVWFDRVVGVVEIPLAIAIVALHARWWAWLGTTALFGGFSGYTAFMTWRGANTCGCFGKAVETSPAVMLGVELAVVALALLATSALYRRGGIAGVALTVAAAAGLSGAAFGVVRTDPRPEEFAGDPLKMLAESGAMTPLLAADLTGPEWIVLIEDPRMELGADVAPAVERLKSYAAEHPNDPDLRVEVVSTRETLEMAGVPHWAWPYPPLGMRIQGGEVTTRFDSANLPDPYALRDDLWSSPTPIRTLMNLPPMSEIANMGSERPAWLIYVYNPSCAYCQEQLRVMGAYNEQYGEDDSILRVRNVSMQMLQDEYGIQIWSWPGVPTSFLVEGGRVTRRYGARSTPDPTMLRQALQSGEREDQRQASR